MKRKFISAFLAFHLIGAYAAPLLLAEDNCDMFCCEVTDSDCEMDQMPQMQHVNEIDMPKIAPCEISMVACEVPIIIFLTVAPIKTIDQKFEKVVYSTQEYDFTTIPLDNQIISNLKHFQIPEPPPSHPAPLLI